MSKFQIILLCLFGGFVLLGLAVFSLYKGKGSQTGPTVIVWGILDQQLVQPGINQVQKDNKNIRITYVQKKEETFDQEYVEALASGQGPDAVLISQDMVLKHQNKLYLIPYTSFSQSSYQSTYIQESNLYLDPSGILAIPFAVDPLVMYWNKDIFTNANIAVPPKYWDEFLTLAPALTTKDAAGNITQSAVGLGEFRNVTNAKEVLSLLVMQAGNSITARTQNGIVSVLTSNADALVSPANAALTFFTQFANPVKEVYTWNRSLPDSKNLFIANELGIYFGYASELKDIQAKNPNLNFGVALMPQVKPAIGKVPVLMTFGKMYGLSIARSTQNAANTLTALYALAGKSALQVYATGSGLPSVRLDSLTPDPTNPASTVFTTSSLWSKAWLDPDRNATSDIFQGMVEDVTSGRQSYENAISNANGRLQALFQ